jgi:hypothetical protein
MRYPYTRFRPIFPASSGTPMPMNANPATAIANPATNQSDTRTSSADRHTFVTQNAVL